MKATDKHWIGANLGDVKLGSAQDLDLADVRVLQRVDALASLLNVLACVTTNMK